MVSRRKYASRKRKPVLDKRIRAVTKSVLASQSELKYFDTLATAAPDYAGYLQNLSLVPQGSTDISRDGDQLYATSIQIRGNITLADTTNYLRVILFCWKSDTTPDQDDILTTTYKGSTNYVLAPYHHDGRSMFTVLSDRTYFLHADKTQVQFNITKKLNKKMFFNAGGTSGKNQVWAMTLSDSAAVSHPSVAMVSRLRFRDF